MSSFQQQCCQIASQNQKITNSEINNQQINCPQTLAEQTVVPTITVHEVASLTSIKSNNDANHQDNIQLKTQNGQNQQNYANENCPIQNNHNQENINEQNQTILSLNEDLQFPEFKVVVHKVNSKQSLLSDHDQFLIQFSKSQLEIPLNANQTQNQPIQQNNFVNVWKKQQSQDDDDIYVKLLQQKWAKKQSETLKQENSHQQNQEKQYSAIFNVFTQISKINVVTNPTSKKQESQKKTHFKIKKLKQDHSKSIHSSLNVTSTLMTPKQTNRISSNKSDFFNTKKQKSLFPINRFSKQNSSTLQKAENSPKKSNFRTKKSLENVHYEFALGKLQRMNQILQDRSYNAILSPIIKPKPNSNLAQQKLTEIKNSQLPVKTVRKVIKRSPYGFLQLEVKDSKNNAKITNLRILKPKEMIKLKKIPKNIKNIKENICE